MHKIDKFLLKLDKKNRNLIKSLFFLIKEKRFDNLDYKKLKGFKDIFRVRKGKIRIIFQKTNKEITILIVDKKRDDTYSL